MSSDRRTFVQQLMAGSLAGTVLPSVVHAEAVTERPGESSGAVPAEWSAAAVQPPATTYDTSWTSKLTGKYRVVFDVPEIHGGSGVWRAGLWRQHYTEVLKAAPADLSSVVVIRHQAMPLLMSHEFWDTYDVAKRYKIRHPMTDKKTRRNPVLMTAADDGLPPILAKATLPEQLGQGTVVLGCGMAFAGMVQLVMQQDKLPPAEARTKAMAMMAPGAVLQPNGIFGVTLAQHHGCAFVAAA